MFRGSSDFRGIRYGALEERIALYADDMLLFLGDVSSSLPAAMSLIEEYGRYSGLRINWTKSVLLPIDPLPASFDPQSTPLQCVTQFSYLGVQVSASLDRFEQLNLVPLISRFTAKLHAWCKLPLSVVGRVNLVKMVWMPQLLYLLHNSPVWLPNRLFAKFNSIFRELIWRKGIPRIRLERLQYGKDEGGLAVPNPELYFLAAQVQHLRNWSSGLDLGSSHALLTHFLGTPHLLPCLERGGFAVHSRKYPTLWLLHKVGRRLKAVQQITGFTHHTPLWDNPVLGEVAQLEGMQSWASKGITLLHQVYENDVLLSFAELQEKFGLPHSAFYQYLRLRHALEAQGRLTPLVYRRNVAISLVERVEATKGLISMVYKHLLSWFLKQFPLSTRAKWERDLGSISDEVWSEVLEYIPKLSSSEAYRLSHIYVIHRVYRTPLFLHNIGLRSDSLCPRCHDEQADLIHMMWNCPRLRRYWGEVLALISRVYDVAVPSSPLTCILGSVMDVPSTEVGKMAIARLLYLARKVIAQCWIQSAPPVLQQFINKVNWFIGLEKGVHTKRGSLRKYDALWSAWLDRSGLAPTHLTRGRALSRLLV